MKETLLKYVIPLKSTLGFSDAFDVTMGASFCEKCPYSELFWSSSLRIRAECGKMWTRVTIGHFLRNF